MDKPHCKGYYDDNNEWQNGFPCRIDQYCCAADKIGRKWKCCSTDSSNLDITEPVKWEHLSKINKITQMSTISAFSVAVTSIPEA